MQVDLHVHTTASDGRFTPEQVVGLAAQKGLKVIAITDHDSVEGVKPAQEVAKVYPSLRVIPGVELNTDAPNGAVHVLGYFVDSEDDEFNNSLRALRDSRGLRAQKMIAKLKELGVDLEWKRVQQLAAGGAVGRPHVAQAMLEGGYIDTLEEAFVKYIGRKGPAYVKRVRLTPLEAVEMLVRAGCLPVLAHPADIDDLEALVSQLKQAGLVGLEAYYNGYHDKTIKRIVALAKAHRLLTSGGSDYHGFGGPDETPIGGADVPYQCVQRLVALAEQKEVLSR